MDATFSILTHEFRQDDTLADGPSYLSAIRAVLGVSQAIDNQRMFDAVFRRSQKSTNTNLDGDEDDKFREVARACRVEIRLVHVTVTPDQQRRVHLSSYGAASTKENGCIYILYDEASKFYKPLCVSLKSDPAQRTTIFHQHDNNVPIILEEFVRDNLKGRSAQTDHQLGRTKETISHSLMNRSDVCEPILRCFNYCYG